MKTKSVVLASVFLFGLFAYNPIAVSAQSVTTGFKETIRNVFSESGQSTNAGERIETRNEIREEKREEIQNRLEERNLKICQDREEKMEGRMTRLMEFSANMVGKFDAIAKRVMDYYEDVVVPGGKTVSNYNELIGEVSAKKNAVNQALTNAQVDLEEFACDGDDPKGILNQYREEMQKVKTYLHEYRTAIKNLIVAVRGLGGN